MQPPTPPSDAKPVFKYRWKALRVDRRTVVRAHRVLSGQAAAKRMLKREGL